MSDRTKTGGQDDSSPRKQSAQRTTLHQIEYKLVGNILGFLIAAGGFTAGYISRDMSMPSWQDNFIILIILIFMTLGMVKNIMTITEANLIRHMENERANESIRKRQARMASAPQSQNQSLEPEQVVMGQIPMQTSARGMTEEQVLEAVAKRLEEKKKETAKKNKFVN